VQAVNPSVMILYTVRKFSGRVRPLNGIYSRKIPSNRGNNGGSPNQGNIHEYRTIITFKYRSRPLECCTSNWKRYHTSLFSNRMVKKAKKLSVSGQKARIEKISCIFDAQ